MFSLIMLTVPSKCVRSHTRTFCIKIEINLIEWLKETSKILTSTGKGGKDKNVVLKTAWNGEKTSFIKMIFLIINDLKVYN